ncbi:hypothetical protein [Halobacillus litoralis]|uniref:hypothetical protein n=1 Tax=Halobacillus litoralis TaxID=45668 RepID=UPI001F4FDED1|nr:hypothetical protein [Halobacillus litoralis]
MRLLSLLSGNGFVMYNKELAHTVSTNGAIVFGQLCSSYESFKNKKMITVRDEKEYFFLTSEVLQEETALTYKQQLRAIKELEQAGYIDTKMMGVPSKKYFHITDKIIKELVSEVNPSSSKREDLNVSRVDADPSLAQRENLSMPKGNSKPDQKGSSIKKKNKKEQYKNKKDNLVNKEPVNNDEIIHKLTNEYRIKGLSNEVCLRVVKEVLDSKTDVENFGGYLRRCLDNTLYKSKLKKGEVEISLSNGNGKLDLYYDWLNN